MPHTGCCYEADRNFFYHSRLHTNDVSPEVATNITLFSLRSHHPPVCTILPTWYTDQRAIQYTATQLFRSGDSKRRGAWRRHGKENELRWQSRQARKQRQCPCLAQHQVASRQPGMIHGKPAADNIIAAMCDDVTAFGCTLGKSGCAMFGNSVARRISATGYDRPASGCAHVWHSVASRISASG